MNPAIAISSGEPAGIGPDICLAAAERPIQARLAIIGDAGVLDSRIRLMNSRVGIRILKPDDDIPDHQPGSICVYPLSAATPVRPGKPEKNNARYVLDCIDTAVSLCLSGKCDALVTAPVQKGIINDAGIPFSGHTEWIAGKTRADHPVMMLANRTLRICLATTHLPLSEVPGRITRPLLQTMLRIMSRDLEKLYGMNNPCITVCGLNPHAGEGGHLGTEEQEIIAPAIAEMRNRGMNIHGPVPADTAFTRENLEGTDAFLAMYHDQGLPVIKHSGFGEAVNITLGLPIIRTSVDHGTALDLAGSGDASALSLYAAIEQAVEFANRKIHGTPA